MPQRPDKMAKMKNTTSNDDIVVQLEMSCVTDRNAK